NGYDIGIQKKLYGTSVGLAIQQFILLQGVDTDSIFVSRCRPELTRRQDIHVRPNAVFRVIGKVLARSECVAVVSTSWITGLGDRDAVVVCWAGTRELTEDPSIFGPIVQYDRIAG